MNDIIMAAAVGGLAGAVYGFVGYFKNKNTDDMFKGFEWENFGITVVGSGLVGAGAGYSGLAYDVYSASVYGVVITQFVRAAFAGAKAYFDKKGKKK